MTDDGGEKPRKIVDAKLLPELMEYCPASGMLTWKVRKETLFKSRRDCNAWNTNFAGTPALNYINNHGYKMGRLLGVNVKAHRAIWAIETGDWPKLQIDHIDGDRANNRWDNLREVSAAENMKNRAICGHNKSGYTGVFWCKRKQMWMAYIIIGKRQTSLGHFSNIEDAAAARAAANEKNGFSPRHGEKNDRRPPPHL